MVWTHLAHPCSSAFHLNASCSSPHLSVALSHSGTWLAVGIPGRSAARGLEGHTYKGAVRVYRRQENMTVFTYIGEIPNPNPSASTFLSFDKFGAKVEWRSVYDDASKQMKTFLFVAANSGWDGATPRYKEAPPNNVNWPLGPTTDVTRAGVYVYHLQQPNQVRIMTRA